MPPFDVIGIQSHVGVPFTPTKRVIEILKQKAAGNEFRGGLGWGRRAQYRG